MVVLKAFHPPAAISPIVVVQMSPDETLFFIPILIGAALLTLLAWISEATPFRLNGGS
jgi:hypothetical protein